MVVVVEDGRWCYHRGVCVTFSFFLSFVFPVEPRVTTIILESSREERGEANLTARLPKNPKTHCGHARDANYG